MAILIQSPEAHPIALDMLLLRAFGPEYYGYEPETIWILCERFLKSAPSEANRAKIQATRTAHLTGQYATRWEVFEKVIAGLAGASPMFGMMQRPPLEDLWAGVVMLKELRDLHYSDEVTRYSAAVLLSFDVHYAPPPLEFCGEHIVDSTTPLVEVAWKRGDPADDEAAVGVQLGLLRAASEYSRDMDQRLVSQLATLGSVNPVYRQEGVG